MLCSVVLVSAVQHECVAHTHALTPDAAPSPPHPSAPVAGRQAGLAVAAPFHSLSVSHVAGFVCQSFFLSSSPAPSPPCPKVRSLQLSLFLLHK